MPWRMTHRAHEDDHTPEAIAARLGSATAHSYLGDGVLGAIDGTVTTFAIVAGASGAGLPGGVAIVLGLANVFADGLSMAVGNYMKSKSERAVVEQARRIEEAHVATIPEGEREEVRQIFARKGFEGGMLDEAVEIITQDRKRWVDTMLTDELGLRLETPEPVRAALTTLLAFIGAGMLPLTPLFLARGAFVVSAVVTAATFFLIGLVNGVLLRRAKAAAGLETLFVGGAAAAVAFLVGMAAKGLIA